MEYQSKLDSKLQFVLSELASLSDLKELALNIGIADINPRKVKAFLQLAIQREMRVLTLRKMSEPTLLNAHRQLHRRKLLQTALLKRSTFQTLYSQAFIMETTELGLEIAPVKYWRDWGHSFIMYREQAELQR